MLKKLYIKNFKCFDELDLEFSYLNYLVGTNSSGKSSVIQALLLLLQNISEKGKSPLNGRYISLGEFKEVANYVNNAKEFILKETSKKQSTLLKFTEKGIEIKNLQETGTTTDFLNEHKFNISNKKIKYIPANRIGYQDLYSRSNDYFNDIGLNAEFIFDYFEKNKNAHINPSLMIDSQYPLLENNVNYWLKKILNTYIRTKPIEKANNVRAEYALSDSDFYVRPKNIGSGISYMVSVLITCLQAEKDDLIIIENPEIHLHPKAQSILNDFFVFVAKAKIQLIIETHSDHLFNGVRKAINRHKKGKNDFNSIDKKSTKIHFFIINNKTFQSEHTEIILNDWGGITNYQKLLFDQFDDDLDELLDGYTHEFDN